jgi:DNA ligase D-like protein (predicted 3'-phosphoesterase)
MPDLDTYQRKRDRARTPEPFGDTESDGGPRFVIQKHDARSLHYDLRLETEGILLSWAVPKGPSTDPRDKRLAIHVEDHPLEYARFEGVIPEGQYGAGAVIVWDTGTYRNLMSEKDNPLDMRSSLSAGHIEVWLDGKKLRGGYALVRIDEQKDHWLLIKMDDEEADARRRPTSTQPESVLSGRSIEEMYHSEKRG